MKTIYQNSEHKRLFEQEKQLRQTHDDLNRQEGELRTKLNNWTGTTPTPASALAKALGALSGDVAPETKNADLEADKTAYAALRSRMDAVAKGIPHAQREVERSRDALTRARLQQPDMQKAMQRSIDAAHALLSANAAMLELCSTLSRAGYATGEHDRDTMVLSDPDAIQHWANSLGELIVK